MTEESNGRGEFSVPMIHDGVSVSFLADAFGIRMETVRRKLARCPKKKVQGRGFLYEFRTACAFLVAPKVDFDQYVRDLKTEDLPPELQKDVWEARLKRLKWEESAKELWRTDDVLEVLADLFVVLKSSVQLWPDHVERQHGLSESQRETLVALGDKLQDEIHTRLVEMVDKKSTPSAAERMREELEPEPVLTLEDII